MSAAQWIGIAMVLIGIASLLWARGRRERAAP
jgi:hypothetical protein